MKPWTWKNFAAKGALITGGASGLGYLLAKNLAAAGARVLIVDLDHKRLGDACLGIKTSHPGVTIEGRVCDVRDRAKIYALASELEQGFGKIDIVIHSAGVVSGKSLLTTLDDDIVKTMEINSHALFWLAKAFLPAMIERGSGRFITLASAAGILGVRGLVDYSASKFAAVGFDDALRMELTHLAPAVRTLCVCPFFVDTGMFAGVQTRVPLLLPILKPEYVCKRIIKAILRGNSRLILPSFVRVVWLLRLFPPAFFDWSARLFGINESMNKFTGRKGKTE